MAELSYVTLGELGRQVTMKVPTDESIGGMLFDTGSRTDVFNGYYDANLNFKDNKVQLIHNVSEAEQLGIIKDGVLNGIPYHHISDFYSYIGDDAPLYLMFADCSKNFDAIIDFQKEANGRLFQVGVWTERQLWSIREDGSYGFSELLSQVEAAAEELSGAIGEPTITTTPLSVLLFPNTAKLFGDNAEYAKIDYRKIPYAKNLDYPKVSVILGQNGTEEVHRMQLNNVNFTPVGLLGIAMACLYIAPAEDSIGYVDYFNLNKYDSDGNSMYEMANPEFGFGFIQSPIIQNRNEDDYLKMSDVSLTQRNIISQAGYIVLTSYPAREESVFFSNDQTLSDGDFEFISMNRVIHKCRRAVKNVMMPYVNGNIDIDPQTGGISTATTTALTNAIIEELNKTLINSRGQEQIADKMVTIDNSQQLLLNDRIEVNLLLIPLDVSDVINVKEYYVTKE